MPSRCYMYGSMLVLEHVGRFKLNHLAQFFQTLLVDILGVHQHTNGDGATFNALIVELHYISEFQLFICFYKCNAWVFGISALHPGLNQRWIHGMFKATNIGCSSTILDGERENAILLIVVSYQPSILISF